MINTTIMATGENDKVVYLKMENKYMQKEMLDIAKIDIDNKGEEYNYWLNNGYLDAKNFQSIIDKKIMK